MTVAASVKAYAGPFVGDDVATEFPLNFPLWDKRQVSVWWYQTGHGIDAVELEPDVDYTVTGAGTSENPSMSGKVIANVPLDTDHEILIVSDYDVEQIIDLVSQARFFPQTHESAWDYRTMLVKQFTSVLDRFIDFDPPTVPPLIKARDIILDGKSLSEFISRMEEYLKRAEDAANKLSRVDPKMWPFTGDGEQVKFYIPDADVKDPRLYMVVTKEGDTWEPDNVGEDPVVENDYNIHIDSNKDDSYVLMHEPPSDGQEFWVLCIGYPRPVEESLINDPDFIKLVKETVQQLIEGGTTVVDLGAAKTLIPTEAFTSNKIVDGTSQSSLLRGTSGDDTTLTIWKNDGNEDRDWKGDATASPYFSVVQRGDGEVTVQGSVGVDLLVPSGCLPKTRTKGSVITLTGDGIAADQWIVSGDMAVDDE